MKQRKFFRNLVYFCCAAVIMFSSCKKDRLIQDEYSGMDSFYNKYKQEEQVFVIDTPATGPIIGKMGTKIYVSKDMFMRPDSTDIDWPYIIKLVEIYPKKDIILWELPTVANGQVFESAAQLRVKAFKDNVELILKPGRKYYMELDTMTNLANNMDVFYGFQNSSITDWTSNLQSIAPQIVDTLSAVGVMPYYYAMFVAKMGWVSCARMHAVATSKTNISITASGINTQNIEIFIVFKNTKAVTQLYSFISGQVPMGELVTVVAMAMNQNNEYVLHSQEISILANHNITLDMQPISESSLLAFLGGL